MNLNNATAAASRFCHASDNSPEGGRAMMDLRDIVRVLIAAGRENRAIKCAIRRGVSRRLADVHAVIESAFRGIA